MIQPRIGAAAEDKPAVVVRPQPNEVLQQQGHRVDDGAAALAEEPSRPVPDGGRGARRDRGLPLRERRHAQEHADEGDALHAEDEVGPGRVLAGERRGVESRDPDGRATISARAAAGIESQIASGSAGGAWMKRAAIDEPGERVALGERGDVVEGDEVDLSSSACSRIGASAIVR